MDLLADTTFLIDLWREQRKAGPATTFAGERADLTLGLPWIVAGEFLGGGVIAGHDEAVLRRFLAPYPAVHSTDAVVAAYARLFAHVRRQGLAAGPNDLWIAACAAALDVPLVTRNARDFAGLPGLRIVTYVTQV